MSEQIYNNYSSEDQKVWSALYNRVMQIVPEDGDEAVMAGIKKIGIPSDRIPDLLDINKRLNELTGWSIVPVEEMVSDREFIEMLSKQQYPCRIWIRKPEEMDDTYCYDIFHDVMGHFPLLTNPNYADFLKGIGKVALDHIDNAYAIELLTRLYWHTVQFGVKISGNFLKIYGAHLLSSAGEAIYVLSGGVPKYDFDVETMMKTTFEKHVFQKKYFVINSYDELFNSLDDIKSALGKMLEQKQNS